MESPLKKPFQLLDNFLHYRHLVAPKVRWRLMATDSNAFESYLDYFHHNCTDIRWMGRMAAKMPSDAWVFQEIVHDTRPDLVIEIGNWQGGSTLFLAHMLDILANGRVLAIDIDHSLIDFQHPRITWITGPANSEVVLSRVKTLVDGTDRAMVIEDSSHTYEHTLSVLQNYSKFVGKGMYFIVEDGICRYPFIENGPKPGPYEAVHEFLREHTEFTIDRAREKFRLTSNPDGYLRRTR